MTLIGSAISLDFRCISHRRLPILILRGHQVAGNRVSSMDAIASTLPPELFRKSITKPATFCLLARKGRN